MDRVMEIALFRYKIICHMLHGGRKNRNQRLKELARVEYEVPGAKDFEINRILQPLKEHVGPWKPSNSSFWD